LPRRGEDFARGYTPALGDVVHLDWAPSRGREMRGPHYALVLSADVYNVATGLVIVSPITSNAGKLSNFEFPVRTGRVDGVVILSEVRSLDYQARNIQYEGKLPAPDIAEANRRVRMIFP
jgi:mRNA-degrading endonuclease toxin of MazEF toxin-antitoxin module